MTLIALIGILYAGVENVTNELQTKCGNNTYPETKLLVGNATSDGIAKHRSIGNWQKRVPCLGISIYIPNYTAPGGSFFLAMEK